MEQRPWIAGEQRFDRRSAIEFYRTSAAQARLVSIELSYCETQLRRSTSRFSSLHRTRAPRLCCSLRDRDSICSKWLRLRAFGRTCISQSGTRWESAERAECESPGGIRVATMLRQRQSTEKCAAPPAGQVGPPER